jgi:hypothetical protein
MRPSDISHGSANSGYPGPTYPSPRDQAELIARSTTPFGAAPPQVYPRGHILEGQPVVNDNYSRSRAPSPNPGMKHNFFCVSNFTLLTVMSGAAPQTEPHQLPAPEAFSRPINAANSYAPFDNMKVIDLDDLYEVKFPKMPIVLTTHDIYPDDWKRCLQVCSSPAHFFYLSVSQIVISRLSGFSSLLDWSASCWRLRQRWTGSKPSSTLS